VPPRGGGSGAYQQGVTCGRLPPAADTLRRTPLFDRHEQAGARLVPFAGWEMPVQYEGIRQEHVAVRTGAGMFDVSHMGEIETSGPQAEELLQRLLSNDVTKIAERGAQYSVLCREDGGVLDDLFTYRLGPDRFLTVTNASNHEKDLAWFREHTGDFDAEVTDAHERWAMLAVQGPDARAALERVAERGLAQAPGSAGRAATALPARMRTAEVSIAGVECLACGTGYTGEDGVELLIPPDGATAVWDALLEQGVVPAGLGARDTLRLEVCFHLYGNDLSEDRNPIEAGLAWCCKLDTGFIGADALRGTRPDQTLVPFAFTGAGIPRQGNPVRTEHGEGVVTSGSLSPCLEVGIGMAYVPVAAAAPGTELEVDVRGKSRAAEVREKPLYRKETSG
jgi:aminomethyltransferase